MKTQRDDLAESTIHPNKSPLAGKRCKIKQQCGTLDGKEIIIEDWWDRVSGVSWKYAVGNPACMMYGARIGFVDYDVPVDDEVLYGKIGNLGCLVHVTELEAEHGK